MSVSYNRAVAALLSAFHRAFDALWIWCPLHFLLSTSVAVSYLYSSSWGHMGPDIRHSRDGDTLSLYMSAFVRMECLSEFVAGLCSAEESLLRK